MTAEVVVRAYQQSIAISGAAAISRAVRTGVERQLPVMVTALAQALDRRLLPDSDLLAINRTIAEEAHSAVAAGYRSRLPRGGTSSNSSALHGTLGSALAGGSMTAGTDARRISFINPSTLNQEAQHWYRVNYGARGPNLNAAGSHPAEAFTVLVNERPLIVLRDNRAPAPYSIRPNRFFFARSGNLIPLHDKDGEVEMVRGAGVRAARFMDLGYAVVATRIGPAYMQLINGFVQTAPGRARLESKDISVLADVRAESVGITVAVS